MNHCKLWVLAYVFKCEHILYLLNLKDICIFSHLILCSQLGIPVRVLSPGCLFREIQYFQKEFKFFTNLKPTVTLMKELGSWFAKYVRKKQLSKSDILKKDKSQD